MTIRRRFLQIAASALIFANSCSWAAPGDWQDTLGTPFDIRPNEVDVRSAQFNGRACVAVELSAEVQERALGAGGNGPTVAILDKEFNNGVIEVDIAGAINGKGSPDSRAFAGLAFHIAGSAQTFEAVYLRMSNGSKNVPPHLRRVMYGLCSTSHTRIFTSMYRASSSQRSTRKQHRLRWIRGTVSASKLQAVVCGSQ